ncbi:uncharacterized protein LOC113338630 [Papaver somniferum]|uniref:uncharacterized protein LOC113338630 n=1 Tax=Papaver somniferum TaxID=3469 RepID=UPI000E702F48|nr:uncharacterized protein LOC113338630 [Papaver somniferum]
MTCFKDYKDTIESPMMKVLQTYFEHANSLNTVWSIRDGEDPYLWDIRIHGDVITQLMNNEYLEEQVIRYYSYMLFKKRKNEENNVSFQQQYAECSFMRPDAWYFVKTRVNDGIAKFVEEFILNIPISVEKIVSSFKVKCKNQALIMAKACMPYLIKRHDQMKISPEIVDIKREPLIYKDIICKNVPEQGHHPDCLIFVCYYMKMSMKCQVREKWLKLKKKDAIKKSQQEKNKMQ